MHTHKSHKSNNCITTEPTTEKLLNNCILPHTACLNAKTN
jgi:hypothetical protein